MSEPDEGQRFKDLWAWADEEEDEFRPDPVDPARCLAVMVVRDAAAWLPGQLAAIAASTQRPGEIVAVDAGSEDDSPALLAEALAAGVLDAVVDVAPDGSFAEAVAAGIGDREPEWLWILHDDASPEPDALAELLALAPTADLLVPKLLAPGLPGEPAVILECGQSITTGGVRVGVSEEGDVDQGQLDPAAVLGGSTAGMLIRGTLWRELGGLAPEIPGHRDGVELGWRANLAGWRVVRAPAAALWHREAGRRRERAARRHPHVDDRLAALRVVGAHGTGAMRLRLGSWARALGFLVAKSPSHARAELAAHHAYARSRQLTRQVAERIPDGDEADVADLLPPRGWGLRTAVDRVGNAISERYRDFTATTSLDELTGDEFADAHGPERRRVSPGLLLVLVVLVVGLAAGWRLWGATDLAGGGLLPAPTGAGAMWDAYLRDGAPALGVGALASSLVFGKASLLSFALVLLGPLVAALTAHALLRSLDVRPGLAAVGAGLWAAATLALGLPSSGDVSGMVVAIVAPLLLRSLHRTITSAHLRGADGLRAPAQAACWLFVFASFWPLALPLATVGAILVVLLRRGHAAAWATVVVPVWLLFLPYLARLFRTPGRWLTGVDPLAWPAWPPSGVGLLLGRVAPSGVPLWLSALFVGGLALVAFCSLLRIPSRAASWAVAATIVVPLVAGVAVSRLALPLDGGSARALLTPWALAVVAGMVAAFVVRAHDREPHGWRVALPVVATGVGLVTLLAWPFVGMRGPVTPAPGVLPAYVTDVLDSPRASRALVVARTEGQLRWNVVDAERPRWGSAERWPAGGFDEEFAALVQGFAGGQPPDDLAEQLAHLGVSHVALTGFDADEVLAVRNVEGLTAAPSSKDTTVFTVVGLVSRATIIQHGGARTPVVDGRIPAGAQTRLLEVSDPRDIRVRVSDTPLERTDGELPTFRLGEGPGRLEVSLPKDWFALGWSAVLLLTLGLLAMPTLPQRTGARPRRSAA
ncbi:glycosyltransferase [uncultured Tessaracoccus sp.]|uniref:glycosyltransferase n=1 Tax=uncultured Tessaracoccus sp. TaxID=905023 RepID=UPI0025DD7112|nr:glycosyltransferase [uncultured Tessaracoccus sp.]